MAEDWKVGDLALVVNTSVIKLLDAPTPHLHTGEACPPAGTIHEVLYVGPSMIGAKGDEPCGCTVLEFGSTTGAVHLRCVKVTPEEEDEFDKEVIELMKEKELLK